MVEVIFVFSYKFVMSIMGSIISSIWSYLRQMCHIFVV